MMRGFGDDRLRGGSRNTFDENGEDVLRGGRGRDVLVGEGGADLIYGGAGDDYVSSIGDNAVDRSLVAGPDQADDFVDCEKSAG